MFEKLEVHSYQREGKKDSRGNGRDLNQSGPQRRNQIKWWKVVRARHVAGHLGFLAVAFFLGQGVLLGELYPFGAAVVAASFVLNRIYAPAALVGAVLGIMSITSGWDQAVNILSLVLVGVAALALSPGVTGLRFMVGGVVFAVLMLTGSIYVTVIGATTYDYVKVLFESVFAALLTIAFYGALQGLQRLARRGRVPAEELFYMALLLICVIAGAQQLQWWGISTGVVMADLAVLLAAYIGRAGLGAGAGAVLGVLPGLIYLVAPAAMGALAFAGLLGGLCRNLGRPGVVVGFMLGQTLLTVYLGQSRPLTVMFMESAAAALVFLLIPRTVLTFLHKYLSPVVPWGTSMANNAGESGVADWERALTDLTCAYDQACGALEVPRPRDRGWRVAINELRNIVCTDCVLYTACWERDSQKTYVDLENTFQAVEPKGRASLQDMSERMRLRCTRVRELVLGISCLHQQYRMNRYWEGKLRESQELVADQLRGMGAIISQIGRDLELQGEKWRGRAEFFKQELKRAGFPVLSLALYPSGQDLEIEVTLPTCNGSGRCRYDLAPLLSTLAGVPMAPAVWDCARFGQEDFCSIRYYSQLRYSLRVGLARWTGGTSTLSGDHYALLPLSGGRLGLILSDGMGTGQTAAAASRATVSLLQQLLKIGFDQHLAMRILNTVMIRQFADENFATVDLFLVDLVSGKVEITKIGAPPSYHLSYHQVDLIGASGSLPVGVQDELNLFTVTRVIAVGDMLVLVTDGVTDVYRAQEADEEENWIVTVLGEIVDLPPQEVADLILRLALTGVQADGGHRDDMTVLVARVVQPDPL